MISKPTGLYPDGDTVATDSILTLSSYVQSGSSIETFEYNGKTRAYSRLVICVNDLYYNFDFNKSSNITYAPYVTETTSGTEIRFELPMQAGAVTGWYHKKGRKSSTIGTKTNIDLYNLIQIGRTYSWKMRLYEKGSIEYDTYAPTSIIGYGSIDSVSQVSKYISDNFPHYTNTGYTFSIFPHQNIYDDVVNGVSTTGHKNISDTVYNIVKNKDNNVKYWLVCEEYRLLISKYRFYQYEYDDSGRSGHTEDSNTNLDFDNDFDSYNCLL